jgi:hypothetical protein
MNTKEEIKNHRLPCGAATVSIESVCRRRLRDHFDALLDRLTEETHPEGRDPEEEDLNDVELPTEEPEETEEEMKKRMIREGKLKVDVKKVVKRYEDKVMPKPKPKAKTSDHSEPEEDEEEELQGNSRLLQRLDGKIENR